ncbi:MAG TPA: adenosylcobinamide-GDP ribazoletransferase [Acetivibrio sp.]|uniref:adenosylcobinamide-GDP ribazoletransferase n=1 Tax=Acetivibrio sp. TaxID=1872092 RepID=UPI002C1F3078|nr:adenosylcobinamide-GDP ribazoletransferase [Acetivibrio sp.]HOM01997.1 adenosylcobinamide-GDP ribazoletransferase [Acetivibrio sp.]
MYIKRAILMVGFLTRIPIPFEIDGTEEDYGKGLVFAPVVGLMIGGIITALFYILKRFFPQGITSILLIAAYIILTGGLHLDGLGDTFDGIFSNRSRERILEIMRDSRIGTNALLAVVCVIILDYALLSSISVSYLPRALLLFPAAGRIGSLIGAGISVYAREGEGLGKSFIDCCGVKEILQGSIIYFLLSLLVLGTKGLLLAALTVMTAFFTVRFFSKKVGGATGDILGAVCELNQTFFLILFYLVK